MDSLKEIYGALSQRIKSPIWGYIVLAFIAINWKALYYLFFSGKPALMKFNFFDANTDPLNLYAYPLGFGLIAALAAPHITNLGALWATKPINAMRIREVSAAHEVLQAKNQLASERENKRAIYEQSLIDQAKRDEEVGEIKDDVRRQKIEEDIKANRKESTVDDKVEPDNQSKMTNDQLDILLDDLDDEAKNLLREMGKNEHGTFTYPTYYNEDKKPKEIINFPNTHKFTLENHRDRLKFTSALNDLESGGFILKKSNNSYEPTVLGYNLSDRLKLYDEASNF